MGVSVKTGTFMTPTVTGAFSVTGLGFQPKAVIFFLSHNLAAWNEQKYGAAAYGWGFGFSTGPTQNGMFYAMTGANNDCNHTRSSTYCLTSNFSYITGATARASMQSLDADGFTLNFDTAGGSVAIAYMAIGGDQVTHAKVFTFDDATSTGNQVITGVGFQPRLLVFGDSWGATTAELSEGVTNSSVRCQLSLLGPTSAVSMCFAGSGSNVVGAYASSLRDDAAYAYLVNVSTSLVGLASLVSLDADGFTMNYSIAPGGTTRRLCLALGGDFEVACGAIVEPAVAGNLDLPVSFTPRGGLLMSEDRPDNTTVVGNTDPCEVRNSWGVWGADGGHYSIAWTRNYSGGATQSSGKYDSTKFEVIENTSASVAPVKAAFDLDASSRNNARFAFSSVTGAGVSVAYLLFGEEQVSKRYPFRRTFAGF